MILLIILLLLGCAEPDPQYDAHIRAYEETIKPEEKDCHIAVKFSGGVGIPLTGCGPGLVFGFDGQLHFGFGF